MNMNKKLRVYTWPGFRNGWIESWELCAATSMLAIARMLGKKRSYQVKGIHEAWYDHDVDFALATPMEIYWKPQNDEDGPWRTDDSAEAEAR